ncbi:hypothetical protein HOD75_04040 [archaeon]|jgi:hypothetical protein|nr:hypothetical protein [Candidatus Woesearchaeota archaeon]MBT4135677.1 hypothetical protein [archaeon]MBT4242038.1 hypothetical protein [archaeon]MBT4417725.1 hypothetical protein [archaeon]
MQLKLITRGLGFGLKSLGIFWAIFDRFICDTLCSAGVCTGAENSNCALILLLVAIIFVISGFVIVKSEFKAKKKLTKKSKKPTDWKAKYNRLKQKKK